MLLTFSKDKFVDQINQGLKIHTIREDTHKRWKKGKKIQFWKGNPRNTKSKIRPYQFAENVCVNTEEIIIVRAKFGCFFLKHGLAVQIKKDEIDIGRWLEDDDIEKLAINDGLTLTEMRDWFVPVSSPRFEGRIIHWTNFLYSKDR